MAVLLQLRTFHFDQFRRSRIATLSDLYAAKFNADKIEQKDLAAMGGPPDEQS